MTNVRKAVVFFVIFIEKRKKTVGFQGFLGLRSNSKPKPQRLRKAQGGVGAPECVKVKANFHVWSKFLVQAGYLDFERVCRSGVERVRR